MIARLWHGSTTPENADAFEKMIHSEALPLFYRAKGFLGGQLLKRDLPNEVEFVALTWFDSLGSVRIVAGDEFGRPVISEEQRKLLLRYDRRTALYSVAIDTRRD